MNSYYYQKYILTHFFKDKILSLYPNNLHCVKVNQDKAPSYAYKSTAFIFLFFEKMRNETRIEAIHFKCIPFKFPDVSLMDYYAFGLIKQALFKQQLWKIANEEWNKINFDMSRNFLLFWESR